MQPRKYFTDQSMYRYFAYRRRAKAAGCPAALSKRLVQSPNRQLAGMKLTLQAPGGRARRHTPTFGRPEEMDNRAFGPGNRRSGSLAGVVLQSGLHVDALVGLERWAVARRHGARDVGARRAGLDPAAAGDRWITHSLVAGVAADQRRFPLCRTASGSRAGCQRPRKSVRNRLAAGGRWIRTLGSPATVELGAAGGPRRDDAAIAKPWGTRGFESPSLQR